MPQAVTPGSPEPAEQDSELATLRAELAALRDEVRTLRSHVAGQAAFQHPATELAQPAAGSEAGADPATTGARSTWSRRGLMLGGLGAAAGAAAGVVGASPAAATTGNLQFGLSNDAGIAPTSLTSSATGAATLSVTNTSTKAAISGVSSLNIGVSGASNSNTGVVGISTSGTGVQGSTVSSAGVQGSATGAGMGVFASAASGPGLKVQSETGPQLLFDATLNSVPQGGVWAAGSVVMTTTGELWVCTMGGSPNSWRLLASNTSAGAFIPLPPTRVYDSRLATPDAGARLTSAANRVISVKDARNLSTGAVTQPNLVPAGSIAITANVTVTETTGTGFIALTPGNLNSYTASAINWDHAGQNLANGLTLTLDAARTLKAFCFVSGTTHLIIDVTGYYRAT